MSVEIIVGDCRRVLQSLASERFDCCVTSPPYFGLRDYGSADQIGLEPSPEAFVAELVAELVAVFREVRRVLRDDGTLWLNLGDSYAGSWGAQGRQGRTGEMATRSVAAAREKSKISAAQIAAHPQTISGTGSLKKTLGLKQKDLIGIPWRVAFALRADGWYLRQDIIWHKPNPIPESVRDRCTKAHEYVFLLSKSKRYFFDAAAIQEDAAYPEGPGNVTQKHTTAYEAGDDRHRTKAGLVAIGARDKRNKRSVWTVASEPFYGAHFATFPPSLIAPAIAAGSRHGGTILDPFGGAGTAGLVADRLGRDAVLIEVNPEFADMARKRIHGDAPLFAEVLA